MALIGAMAPTVALIRALALIFVFIGNPAGWL